MGLIPGRSAFEWLGIERVLAIAGWVTMAVSIALGVLASTGVPLLWVGFAVLFIVASASIALGNSSAVSLSRQRAEARAGYTTIPWPNVAELDLVLPRTGEIVRPRGGTPVEWGQYRQAVAAAGTARESA